MVVKTFGILILVSATSALIQQNSILASCPPHRITRPGLLLGGAQCLQNAFSGDVRKILNPETGMNTTELLTYRNYTWQTYETTSEDGYISLTVRVTGGSTNPARSGKEPVLIFHGIATSSGSWMIQPGERNLVAKLITAGYEVWLINGRGSNSSIKHTTLNADRDLAYWEYTFDEMGTKDMPPIIDTVLSETGFNQTHYICYSMGCLAFLTGVSEMPELNQKFKTSVMFAPGGYVGQMYGPLRWILNILRNPILEVAAFRILKGRVTLNTTDFTLAIGLPPETLCVSALARCTLCDNIIFALFGVDASQMNFTNLPFALSQIHDVTPLRLLAHGAQLTKDCTTLNKYDYGSAQNLIRYGSPTPPAYNLTRVTVPTYIFYGEADNMITEPDATRTANALAPEARKLLKKVDWPLFNHNDFIMAKDADILLYNDAVEIINNSPIV